VTTATLIPPPGLCRFNLPVVIIIFNNAGIYGGDRRQQALADAAAKGAKLGGFGSDPIPTAFVAKAR
jgi:hypothetical protein